MKKLLLTFSLTLLMAGCSGNTDSTSEGTETPNTPSPNGVDLTVETQDWVALQAEGFSVMAPAGWVLTPAQGIDSYIGTISGDGVTLDFDYGMYSGSFKDEPGYVMSKEVIDGKEGIIYLPSSTIEGSLNLFVQATEAQSLSITGEAASMQERLIVLEVMRSVDFQ